MGERAVVGDRGAAGEKLYARESRPIAMGAQCLGERLATPPAPSCVRGCWPRRPSAYNLHHEAATGLPIDGPGHELRSRSGASSVDPRWTWRWVSRMRDLAVRAGVRTGWPVPLRDLPPGPPGPACRSICGDALILTEDNLLIEDL